MKKRLLSLLLACLMLSSVAFAAAPVTGYEDSYYAEAAQFVLDNEYMQMTEAGFLGEENADRASVFYAFYMMQGAPEAAASTFTDVAGTWYEASAAWAQEVGLSNGDGNGAYNGDRDITRQELATIIVRYANITDLQLSIGGKVVASMADYDTVADWALQGMRACYNSGFITGKPGSLLAPVDMLSRGELATILHRICNYSAPETLTVTGQVTEIEKYGHAVLDVAIADMPFAFGDILTVTFDNGYTLDAPYIPDYSVDKGEFLVRGYHGHTYIAICINYGKLNEDGNIEPGAMATITMKEQAGFLTEYEISQLERTNNREDYSSDEVFANFRPIVMGDIAEGKLYRSSSPVNPELGRASYASKLAGDVKIATFINLADAQEDLDTYFAAEDFASPYYKSVYDAGNVVFLAMPIAYESEEFKTKLGEGLVFMSEHEGPYLVHCNEGKDRAGFTSVLLEALMGATLEEIRADYLMSYINYYGVEKDSDKYSYIQTKHFEPMIAAIAGLESGADLTNVDLAAAANDYILSCGVTQAQIDTIVASLK